MGDNSGRSGRIVACGLAAALGLAAGVVLGLAIGGLKSESRQWIEAERDRLIRENAFLTTENELVQKNVDSTKLGLARVKAEIDELRQDWTQVRESFLVDVEKMSREGKFDREALAWWRQYLDARIVGQGWPPKTPPPLPSKIPPAPPSTAP
jgi:hypothetical protein